MDKDTIIAAQAEALRVAKAEHEDLSRQYEDLQAENIRLTRLLDKRLDTKVIPRAAPNVPATSAGDGDVLPMSDLIARYSDHVRRSSAALLGALRPDPQPDAQESDEDEWNGFPSSVRPVPPILKSAMKAPRPVATQPPTDATDQDSSFTQTVSGTTAFGSSSTTAGPSSFTSVLNDSRSPRETISTFVDLGDAGHEKDGHHAASNQPTTQGLLRDEGVSLSVVSPLGSSLPKEAESSASWNDLSTKTDKDIDRLQVVLSDASIEDVGHVDARNPSDAIPTSSQSMPASQECSTYSIRFPYAIFYKPDETGNSLVLADPWNIRVDLAGAMQLQCEEWAAVVDERDQISGKWLEDVQGVPNVCANDQIAGRVASQWTLSSPGFFACYTCVRGRRLCMKQHDGLLRLLPLPTPVSRTENVYKKAYFVIDEGDVGDVLLDENIGLWMDRA